MSKSKKGFTPNKDSSFFENLYAQLLYNAGGQDYIDETLIPQAFPNDPAREAQLTSILNDNSRVDELNTLIDTQNAGLRGMFDERDSITDNYNSLIDTLTESGPRKYKSDISKLQGDMNRDMHELQYRYNNLLKDRKSARLELKDIAAAKDSAGEELGAMFAKHKAAQDAFAQHPFSTKVDLGNGVTGNSLKNTGSMLLKNIQAHPYISAGMGALGAANVAGLVDDNKVGAQLIGGAAGAALPALFGASPMTTIALGATGGALGSLFDKLRAKKESEQQSMYQQQEY
jgi:hypothetical protein